nr:thioesterase family protein [Halalkalicoccus sp. NIPERK01]
MIHGATVFDWQLVATQKVAAAVEYPFGEILYDGGIPFAPVVVGTTIDRYPTIEDRVDVEVVPLNVGTSSVELLYEMTDDGGDSLASARMTHVTIGPDGTALPLPDRVRSAFADRLVDRNPAVGPDEAASGDGRDLPTFESSVPIRSPHIEGAELAYFEEYPRFAGIALEEFLRERGTSLGELSGEKQPFRLRDWRWEHRAPVPFESTLRVECDVIGVDYGTIRVEHTLLADGRVSIKGITEYGCFDRSGAPVSFDEPMLAPFES